MDALENTETQAVRRLEDMAAYRGSEKEQERIRSLFRLVPEHGRSALDIGARDGYLSLRLADRFASVTALDLETPRIDHPAVACVRGDMTAMEFPDRSFDLVLCAEVLEHIPPGLLPKACAEIGRVARDRIVIGVPYRQDLRLWRTLCGACGGKNPPWGHVNSFDEKTVAGRFPEWRIERIEFAGNTRERTNFLSVLLMDFAGNPYGTYSQEEGCVHCGARIRQPGDRSLLQRAASFAAHRLWRLQMRFVSPRPNWIHLLLTRSDSNRV